MKKASKKIVLGDVKSFTINRKKWSRGGGDGNSLLNENGSRCCLGFYAQACGVSDAKMLNESSPQHIAYGWKTRLVERYGYGSYVQNKRTTSELIAFNDMQVGGEIASEEAREKKIASLFRRFGIEVKFVG